MELTHGNLVVTSTALQLKGLLDGIVNINREQAQALRRSLNQPDGTTKVVAVAVAVDLERAALEVERLGTRAMAGEPELDWGG